MWTVQICLEQKEFWLIHDSLKFASEQISWLAHRAMIFTKPYRNSYSDKVFFETPNCEQLTLGNKCEQQSNTKPLSTGNTNYE